MRSRSSSRLKTRAGRLLAGLTVLCIGAPAASAVEFEWATVGDTANRCKRTPTGCFGAVGYEFLISKHETTNAQFAEFLNAIAADDPNGIYTASMSIEQTGSAGSHAYAAVAGRENMPVNHVEFFDALRFANWLHNGQPTGPQDATTTEDGSYSFLDRPRNRARKAGATFVIPMQDEWFKAAYYDLGSGVLGNYFEYPAGDASQPACALPGGTPNTANCGGVVDDLTDVGSYTASVSPSGCSDMGGNVAEWNEDPTKDAGRKRRYLRGGNFGSSASELGFRPRPASLDIRQGRGRGENASSGFRVVFLSPASGGLALASPSGIDTRGF